MNVSQNIIHVKDREQIDNEFDLKLDLLTARYKSGDISYKSYMYDYRVIIDWYGRTLRLNGYSRV